MTMTYTIEKNVPLPKVNLRDGSIRDTISKMEIGDSFASENIETIRGCCYSMAKSLGIRLATRQENGKLRVWRIG